MATLTLDNSVVVTIDQSGNQLVHCSGSVQISGIAPVSGITPISGITPVSGITPISGIVPVSGITPVSGVGPINLFVADVVNKSTKLSSTDLQNITVAVKKQLDNECLNFWGHTAAFNLGARISGHATLTILDKSDTPGDLGWHDYQNGNVQIEAFYVGTLSDLSVTISHEMLETISDLNANTTVKGTDSQGKPCLLFTENADPVESSTYKVNNIDVSDFVTPKWFNLPEVKGTPDERFDYLQIVNKPFQLAQGGYSEISYDNGQTWTEEQARTQGRRYNKHN